MKTHLFRPPFARAFLSGVLLHSQAALAQDAIVAPDGKGTFKTVQEAVNAAPLSGQGKTLFWVSIKPGTYREKLTIPKGRIPIKLTGEDPAKTILTFNDSAETINATGKKTGTFDSASTLVLADEFTAENLTFENSFGRGSQALALHFAADQGVFRRCRFTGWQDTLLLKSGRAYFENCVIEGVTDFIFGGGAAWFEKCELRCLAPGFITAASTPEKQRFGFVFADGKITGTGGNWKTYLGRPWRPFGSVTFLRTEMPDIIRPVGWHNWDNASNEQTARYAEFDSRGPGARPQERASWSKQLTPVQASAITIQHALEGWNPNTVLSGERISALPSNERTKWESYLQRSNQHLSKDKAILAAEVKAANLSAPLKAPDGPDFKLPSSPPSSWFGTDEAKLLATAVVSFQIPSGGWSKHLDFTKGPRAPGMHWSSQSTGKDGWHYVGTFDNRSTTEQLHLLAGVFGETRREEFKASFLKGLDYLFDAQFPNGGWPQVYPLEGGYHDHVTFNDDAMVHILQLLNDVARRDPQVSFVDEERRKRAATALENGIRCILKAQVVQNGRKTVWCAQHEPLTLATAPARYIEPPALSGGESVSIVRFLMNIPNPPPSIVSAIEDAVAWFERSKITGVSAVKHDGSTRYQKDPESKEVRWARFYNEVTNQPMFPGGQTGAVYDTFEQMAAENRVGYDFYVQSPANLLAKDLPKWRAKLQKL
jgi:PelA/Pel-15E family pectate lyase